MPPGTASLKKPTILILALIVVVTAALRLPLLDLPFERDEGEYAYIAWRLGHGELPYRDWVDQKPPAIFWVYRLALALPLESIRAVRFMGMLWATASACALFFLARRFTNDLGAATTAVLFAVLSVDPTVEGPIANTELFMLLPLILSQLAFFSATVERRGQVLYMMLCGVLTGLAVAFKQVAGVSWLFLAVIYPLFVGRERRWRSTLHFVLWSAAGAVAVWGLIGVYFFMKNGLDEFVHNVLTHNLQYVSAMPWSVRWKKFLGGWWMLAGTQSLVWLVCLAACVALYRIGRRTTLAFLGGGLLSSMVGVSASGYFFPHYYQQLIPVLALAAGLGAEGLCQARGWIHLPLPARWLAMVVLLLILPLMTLHPFLLVYSPTESIRKMYPGHPFAEMPELGARLAQATQPEDRVFIFGAEPELLFYARRVSATRYIFLYPLYGPYPVALERQKATVEEVVRARPTAALYYPSPLFFVSGAEQYLTRWTENYFRENFRVDSWLTLDFSLNVHVLPVIDGQEPVTPDEQTHVGNFLLRTAP